MKTIQLLCGAALLVFCGCTRILVQEPVGMPVPDDVDLEIAGDWIGPEGEIWTVVPTTNRSAFRVSFNDDGKTKEWNFTITLITNKTPVVWLKHDDTDACTPMRVIPGDKSVVLLYPDESEIQTLVDSGSIQGTNDTGKKFWLLSTNQIEPHLAGKQFWRLDWALPLLRKTSTNAPAASDR